MKKGLLRYQGGKIKMARELLSLAPRSYSTYCEPFAGGAGVFWSVSREKVRWLNDIDSHIVGLYQWLRDDPGAVNRFLATIGKLKTADDIQMAFRLARLDYAIKGCPMAYLLLNRFAYGQFVRELRPNFATFSYHHLRNGLAPLTQTHLDHCRNLLQGVRLTQWDFTKVLEELPSDAWAMIDPPYFEMGWYNIEINQKQHEQLAAILRSCKFKFLLTIAHCKYSHRLYGQGHFNVLRRQYSYAGILRREQPVRTELIVRNY